MLCGVDFSEQQIYLKLPDCIRFSMDGQYPCSFRNSWIFFIEISDITATVITSNGKYRITAFENGYVIMWNCIKNQLVWDKSFSEFVEDGRDFEYAIFSDNESIITLVSCNFALNIDVITGEIISLKSEKGLVVIDVYFECTEKYPKSKNVFNEDLRKEILSQMPQFINCDFTGAEFFDDEGMELMKLMGAVVD